MIRGLLGKKLGMAQIFDKDGNVIPVTLVEAGPCTVLELKESPIKIKIGFEKLKASKVNKPRAGIFRKLNVDPMRTIKEFSSTENSGYKIGQEIKVDIFKPGDYVDITGTSIGKGFQGGMKRHGWSGGPAAHGSMHHRRVGSISSSACPSRTFRGRTMPGHMGNKTVTIQGLRVMGIESDKNLILVKGAVPGCRNGIVLVNISQKKFHKSLDEKMAVVAHKVNPMKQSKAQVGAKKGGKKK